MRLMDPSIKTRQLLVVAGDWMKCDLCNRYGCCLFTFPFTLDITTENVLYYISIMFIFVQMFICSWCRNCCKWNNINHTFYVPFYIWFNYNCNCILFSKGYILCCVFCILLNFFRPFSKHSFNVHWMSSYFKDGFSNIFWKTGSWLCKKRRSYFFWVPELFHNFFLFILHDHLSQLNCDNASLLFGLKLFQYIMGNF